MVVVRAREGQGRRAAFYHFIVAAQSVRRIAHAATRLFPTPRVGVTTYEVILPTVPRALDGFTILHISDLHLHPGSELAWQLPALLDPLAYDLVAWTGDFVDATHQFVDLRALLGQILPRAPAYAVLGNHDREMWDVDDGDLAALDLERVLRESGIEVLTNGSRSVRADHLIVAGVDDPVTGHADLDQALCAVSNATERESDEAPFTILLSHSPDIVRVCARRTGRPPDLILSGHTHGGQVRLPFVGALRTQSALPRDAISGLHNHAGISYLVSPGVGYSGLDVRLNCPPEIGLVRLRRGPRPTAHGPCH